MSAPDPVPVLAGSDTIRQLGHQLGRRNGSRVSEVSAAMRRPWGSACRLSTGVFCSGMRTRPGARYEELYDAQEAGAVFLGEQGCGYASLLVMTGPHQGAVWEDLRPADGGIASTGHDFAHWYRSWLERTEAQLARL